MYMMTITCLTIKKYRESFRIYRLKKDAEWKDISKSIEYRVTSIFHAMDTRESCIDWQIEDTVCVLWFRDARYVSSYSSTDLRWKWLTQQIRQRCAGWLQFIKINRRSFHGHHLYILFGCHVTKCNRLEQQQRCGNICIHC